VGIYVSDNRGFIYPLSIIINETKCPAENLFIKTATYSIVTQKKKMDRNFKKIFRPKLELLVSNRD